MKNAAAPITTITTATPATIVVVFISISSTPALAVELSTKASSGRPSTSNFTKPSS